MKDTNYNIRIKLKSDLRPRSDSVHSDLALLNNFKLFHRVMSLVHNLISLTYNIGLHNAAAVETVCRDGRTLAFYLN